MEGSNVEKPDSKNPNSINWNQIILALIGILGTAVVAYINRPDPKKGEKESKPKIDTSVTVKKPTPAIKPTLTVERCSEQIVKMAYKQILGESPNKEELQDEADALESKNSTTKDLVRKLAHSDTFKQKFLLNGTAEGVNQIFYRLLGNHTYLTPDHLAIKRVQEIGWDAYIDGVIDDSQKEYVDKWGNDKVPRDMHGPQRPVLPCK